MTKIKTIKDHIQQSLGMNISTRSIVIPQEKNEKIIQFYNMNILLELALNKYEL